jgi:hypothetical protein
MSLGTGIFLSACLISFVALFALTKDRWNWKRLVTLGLGLPVLVGSIGLASLQLYRAYEGRLKPQDEFMGVRLGATPADLRFLLGEPEKARSSSDQWVFPVEAEHPDAQGGLLIARFKQGTLRHISYTSEEPTSRSPILLGFRMGSHYDEVLERLGKPSNISEPIDRGRRLLSFARYQAVFEFERGRVVRYGLYNPELGAALYEDEPPK